MLLRFGVENYKSFRDYEELSFVSGPGAEEPSYRLSCPSTKYGVLPVVGLWGANASGKSNLLTGFGQMRNMVETSFSSGPDDVLPFTPWRLTENKKPTTFDVDLVVDGIRYHYGFTYDLKRILGEWLYYWPKRNRVRLFDRTEDSYKWGMPGRKKSIADSTRSNGLFLSAGARQNQKLLVRIHRALCMQMLAAHRPSGVGRPLFQSDVRILQKKNYSVVRGAMAAADLGVTDFSARRVELDGQALLQSGTDTVRRASDEPELYEIVLSHGEAILPPEDESSGTHALLQSLDNVLGALEQDRLLIVDEIETNLHPDLCAELIRLFTNERSNPHGAQLLFTSHSRELLDELRRDEVVLVEKNREGVSSAHSLAEFRGIKKDALLRRLHRRGEVGGVPIITSFVDVVAELWLRQTGSVDGE